MVAPQSGNEVDRLVDVGTVLSGWLDRLQGPAIARATHRIQSGLDPLIASAGAPDRRIETLPVDSIAIGGNERYVVKPVEFASLLGRLFPRARLGTAGRRARTEIYNGTGALGVAQAVAAKVVPAGARILRTDNVDGFGVKQTQIVYYQDSWRGAAQRLVDVMGCGSLRKARPDQDLGIADVTIIVGSDCPAYGAPGGAS
jgi:hypothetical protein